MTAGQENYLDVAFDKGLQLTFPPVLVQLLQALLEPSPSFKAISGYLQMDPMLASKTLHIANSSSYGFSSRITDLERAAIAIGTDQLLKLVIALSLQKRLTPKHKREARHEFGDWRMTLWAAIAAEAIASRICPLQKQEAYLAGMLKDLPLYLELCRDSVPPFLARPGLATLPWPGQMAEELSHWGYSHPELTRDIFLYWGLPIELADAVRQHHDFTGTTSHSRLTQSVIYATRWSELLHAPGADPAQAVAFELAMSAELGLDAESAAAFRATCAESFNLLLSRLGIQQGRHADAPLHDQPVQTIQRAYFLALGAASECSPLSPQSLAATVQRYLRLFWNRTTFELFLNLADPGRGSLFRSVSASDLTEKTAARTDVPARPDWLRLPLSGATREYGFLALPRSSGESGEDSSLSMFVRLLGMQIENRSPHGETLRPDAAAPDLPFAPGAVTWANPHQALALAHDGLMESLLRALPFQLCLLDAAGEIVWADAPYRHMLGANIFTLFRPAEHHRNGWNAAFLPGLTSAARLNVSMAGSADPRTRELILAPIRGSQGASYLLLMAPDPAAK